MLPACITKKKKEEEGSFNKLPKTSTITTYPLLAISFITWCHILPTLCPCLSLPYTSRHCLLFFAWSLVVPNLVTLTTFQRFLIPFQFMGVLMLIRISSSVHPFWSPRLSSVYRRKYWISSSYWLEIKSIVWLNKVWIYFHICLLLKIVIYIILSIMSLVWYCTNMISSLYQLYISSHH